MEDDEEEEDNVYGEEVLTSYDSTLAAEGDITMERKFGWTGALQAGWEIYIASEPACNVLNDAVSPLVERIKSKRGQFKSTFAYTLYTK